MVLVAVLIFIHQHILQLIIGFLTVCQQLILVFRQVIVKAILIRAVVVDVYLSEAINQRQVAITIDATDVVGAQRDEVSIVYIAHRCCCIAIHRHSVGRHNIATLRDVTTGKHRIMDDDAIRIVAFEHLGPLCCTV